MDKKDCFLLGEIQKVHGYQGELVVRLQAPADISAFTLEEPVFLEIDGGLVPFFLVALEERDERSLLMQFEDIDSETRGRALVGKQVYLPGRPAGPRTIGNQDISMLVGYEVIDTRRGLLGKVLEVEEFPMHLVFRVKKGQDEFLVPLHEDLIRSIDPEQRQIVMDLPEGLMEV